VNSYFPGLRIKTWGTHPTKGQVFVRGVAAYRIFQILADGVCAGVENPAFRAGQSSAPISRGM
jgi:hypothetical protein